MLYTEGNLTAEDRALRHVARSKIRTALSSIETRSTALLDSLVSELSTHQQHQHLNLDRLLAVVERQQQSQHETAVIERYTSAFPEFADVVSTTYERIRTRSRQRLEHALAPVEHQRRFQYTKGLAH